MIDNSGLLENWICRDGLRLRGYVHNHVRDGKPGPWSSDREYFFSIQKRLSKTGSRLSKGDIIKTNSSVLVLGNPRK